MKTFLKPEDINDLIILALGSPLGLLSVALFLIIVAVVVTWFIRGYFDKFMTWKAYRDDQKKEKEEARRAQEKLNETVQSNSAHAIAEVKKIGQDYQRIIEQSHQSTAAFLSRASEEIATLMKVTSTNTDHVNRLLGAYELLLKQYGIDVHSLTPERKVGT